MLRRYSHSLEKCMAAHPDGCPDSLIASALAIDVEEVEEKYQEIAAKLRKIMRA